MLAWLKRLDQRLFGPPYTFESVLALVRLRAGTIRHARVVATRQETKPSTESLPPNIPPSQPPSAEIPPE